MTTSKKALLLVSVASAFAASCSGGGDPGGAIASTQNGNDSFASGQVVKPAIGESCATGQPDHICLAIDYVAYKHADGTSLSPEAAANNIHAVNQIHAQCNIGFQIEKFSAVVPGDSGLSDGSGTLGELDQVREAYSNDNELLVVSTGQWGTPQIAWTQMPGAGVYGAIISSNAATSPEVIAHELGHYLGLDHTNDESNLMNPVVYTSGIYPSQCEQMRNAAEQYWKRMYR